VVKGVARVPETRSRDKTGQRHGDAAVALAMAIHAREKLGGVEPWDCQTIGDVSGQIGGFDWGGYCRLLT
jgi:phage FluMu gp28-like protein